VGERAKSAIIVISPEQYGDPIRWASRAFSCDAVVTNPQTTQRYSGTATGITARQ
jgi:hypothetical protein